MRRWGPVDSNERQGGGKLAVYEHRAGFFKFTVFSYHSSWAVLFITTPLSTIDKTDIKLKNNRN